MFLRFNTPTTMCNITSDRQYQTYIPKISIDATFKYRKDVTILTINKKI